MFFYFIFALLVKRMADVPEGMIEKFCQFFLNIIIIVSWDWETEHILSGIFIMLANLNSLHPRWRASSDQQDYFTYVFQNKKTNKKKH